MAHKVHPKIYRIRGIGDWQSRGFYNRNFPQFLEEDAAIRELLESHLKEAGIADIIIERFPGKINIVIDTMRPGVIIGRGGGGVERIRKESEKIINKIRKSRGKAEASKAGEIKIDVREIANPWINSSIIGQWIAEQIEKRFPVRRCIKRAMERVMANKEIKGARIEIAGRLGGKEIARREWLQRGQLPRQTIRADIDYAQKEAYCTYGVIGIKVWLYKGEKFE